MSRRLDKSHHELAFNGQIDVDRFIEEQRLDGVEEESRSARNFGWLGCEMVIGWSSFRRLSSGLRNYYNTEHGTRPGQAAYSVVIIDQRTAILKWLEPSILMQNLLRKDLKITYNRVTRLTLPAPARP